MTEIRNITCKTNPVQRANGGNAVAAAAYRAGENLRDENTQKTFRFAGRSHDVESATIHSSDPNAPAWHYDRAALWTDIDQTEKRKDARTGRDVVLGIAWELTPEERTQAVQEFAQKEFLDRGFVVDIAFHKYGSAVRKNDRIFDSASGEYITGEAKIEGWKAKGYPFLEAHQTQGVDMPHVKIERIRGGDISGYKIYQPHAHILVSARPWDKETGAWAAKKDTHLDKPETCMGWKYDWARTQNRYLEAAGWEVRVSCTSGSSDDALPIKSETLPNQAYHIERRDEPTTVKIETDFNRVQNEAIRASVAQQEHTETGDFNDTPRVDTANIGSWWRNMREHFTEQRETWRNQFSSAWDRVKERWRAQPPPEKQATPDTTIQAENTSPEPLQAPEIPPHTAPEIDR